MSKAKSKKPRKTGKLASELTEDELRAVLAARRDGLSFRDLEPKFKLHRMNGMTAFRAVNAARKAVKNEKDRARRANKKAEAAKPAVAA